MSVRIEFDQDALRPLVHLAVAEALDRVEEERAKLNGRLAFTEPEAAVLLGDKAPWSVGWFDPDGKKKSKRIGARSLAEKFARKIEGQFAAGTYQGDSRKKWKQFTDEYDADLAARVDPETRRVAVDALKRFAKLIKPVRVDRIRTKTIDQFVALRRGTSTPTPATGTVFTTCGGRLPP
jgi:hypothetical protein